MRRRGAQPMIFSAFALTATLLLSGCGDALSQASSAGQDAPSAPPAQEETETNTREILLQVNGTALAVEWEDNAAVQALTTLLEDGPITVYTTRYGGFEQVGDLPQSLPAEDTQIQTAPGDIVLYNENSMVLFYGSNTWSYTRLGHITGCSQEALETLLDTERAEVTLALSDENGSEAASP